VPIAYILDLITEDTIPNDINSLHPEVTSKLIAMQTEQSTKKRLFLLDAYALIFRGYYALIKNPRVNSKGLDTSAIMGFVNALFDVINKEKPELLGVCFDKGGSVERTELFSEYKANRLETPEAIKIAVPYIEKILNGLKIPVVVKEGYEADDLIGTLAKKAEKKISPFIWLPLTRISDNSFQIMFLCIDLAKEVRVQRFGECLKFKSVSASSALNRSLIIWE